MGSVWLSIFLVIRDLPTPRSRHPAPDPWRMAEGVGVRPALLPARHSAPDPWRMAEDGCPSPCQPCQPCVGRHDPRRATARSESGQLIETYLALVNSNEN